jgi:hypothetical protein
MLGEWLALPLIETAGSKAMGDEVFNEIFHPIAHSMAKRCDACLRIGGPSQGADGMVDLARANNQKVYFSIDEIPVYDGEK